MKFIISENKQEQVAFHWLNKNYGDLEIFEMEKYPDYIFFMKNGDVIFDYNKKNGNVLINYTKIWSFLKMVVGMSYQQIQDLTKTWMEEHYKLEVTFTQTPFYYSPLRWRNITK